MAKFEGEIWLNDPASKRLALDQLGLLEAIQQTGSISAAAKQVGISYKTAWDRLDALNNLSKQALVLRAAGGSKGGGTQLTEYGNKIVQGFVNLREYHQDFIRTLNSQAQSLDDIGSFMRRSSLRASARNQFLGSVSRIETGSVNAEVCIELAESLQLIAVVTLKSIENMDLSPSDSIMALIKASAVTIAVGTNINVSARNKFIGAITRLDQGSVNTDVTIDLSDGKTLSAVITNRSVSSLGLEESMTVSAFFKASSVILLRV